MRVVASFVTPVLRLVAVIAAVSACAPQPSGGAARQSAAQTGPQSPRVAPAGPAQVALLVPRGAAQARDQAMAADIEAAARLAMTELGAGRIDLRVYDTAADPARAAQAAQAAVAEGAAILLGPVFSATTRAVAPVAQGAGTTVLSFSSDSAAGGPPVWVMGDLPENEADRLMAFAASQGIGAVAVARPRNAYGALAEQAARQGGARHGVRVVSTLDYQRSFEGVQTAVAEGAPAIVANAPQALLIADGGQALRAVAAFMDYYDVAPAQVRYMGLSQWRNPETLQERALRGGWFAGVDPAAGAAFEARFRAATGRAPHPLAGLGYDAVAAVAAMLAEGGPTPFDATSVTRPQGFKGVRGPFRFTAGGTNQRAMAIFEVTEGGFDVLDPAPGGFVAGL